MRISVVFDILVGMIKARSPVLLTGAPGVGKSDTVTQAAIECQADMIISHPVVEDPTDVKGLPWFREGKDEAVFLPFGQLAAALKADRLTVWLLDDLGQATPAVQASYMQLLLARRVGQHVLPDCVTFVAATNRRSDRAGVSGILEPVKSRFATILEVTPHIDDWCSWAMEHRVDPMLIAFLRMRPDLLCAFAPTAEIVNSPIPRTWSHVNNALQLGFTGVAEQGCLAGAVGEGAAGEFLAFRRMAQEAEEYSLDEILAHPTTAKIPDPSKMHALYAIVCGLAAVADKKTYLAAVTYAERLQAAGLGEYAALFVKDLYARDSKTKAIPDAIGVQICTGPLAEHLNNG